MSEERKIPGRQARRRRSALGALSGVLAGYASLAVAELVSAAVRPEAGPVVAVGGAAIDRTPAPVKDWAIRTFGTQDKLVLQLGILLVLVLIALALGVFAARHRRVGAAGVSLFGVVGAFAATERPDSTGLVDALPSLVGAVVGAGLLYVLAGAVRGAPERSVVPGQEPVSAEAGAARTPAPRTAVHLPVTATTAPAAGRPDDRQTSDDRQTPDRRQQLVGRAQTESAERTDGAEQAEEAERADRAEQADGAERTERAAEDTQTEANTRADGEQLANRRLNHLLNQHLSRRLGRRFSQRLGRRSGGSPRRKFLALAAGSAVAATAAGALGRSLNGSRGAGAIASRARIVLPAPVSHAPPVPRAARLAVKGISPFLTPGKDLYRVDTALVVPKIDAGQWRLRIHGKGVARPVTLGFDDLLRRDLIERHITLTCVSNAVGGPYTGNIRWLGVPLADLLAECGVRPPSKGGPADQLVARSVDGMTLGSPVEDVMDGRDALLAIGMNGEPLTFDHGFPVRMVVPGLYGYVSACKWLQELELTTFEDFDPYWVRRDWARRAPIKTASRIDTPKPLARLESGPVTIAGVAWAQRRGIERVEVRIDDGAWQDARLAAEDTRDTWRQWSLSWQAVPGNHSVTVRATDGTGQVQTSRRAKTVPDGASGHHSVVITVD